MPLLAYLSKQCMPLPAAAPPGQVIPSWTVSTHTLRRATLSGLNLTFLLTLAHGTNDAFSNVLPVFLPTLQARFGLGEAVLAVMVAVISISSNVLQPFFGGFVDRWGRRKTAALGLIVGSVLMGFISVAPNVWSLFFVLAVGGLGSAIFHPAAASMARNTGAKKSLSMSLFAAGGSLGSALMPIVVLSVMRGPGIGYVPLLSAFGVLVGLAVFTLTPRQTQTRPQGGARTPIFNPSLLAGPVGLLALAGILRAMAFISFINGMPLFLALVRGYAPDAQVIGLTLSLYSGAAAVGGILAGLAVTRFGRGRLIVGTMLLALPALLLVLQVPTGSALYFTMVAFSGLLTNASIPLLVVSAQDLAPNDVAAASGLLMGFTWGVAGVVYIGFGALQQFIGIAPAITIGFTFLVPAALVVGLVLRRHAGQLTTD